MLERLKEGIANVRHTRGNGSFTDLTHEEIPTQRLVKDLVSETQHLVREEIYLAKLELRAEAKRVGKGAGAMGAAGILGHVALLCFAACVGLLLSLAMAGWVAALLTTMLFGAVGAGLFSWGRKQVQNLKPEHTIHNLEEDRRWMKDTLQRVKSRNPASA